MQPNARLIRVIALFAESDLENIKGIATANIVSEKLKGSLDVVVTWKMKSSVGSSVGVMNGKEGVEYAKENSGLAGNFDEEVNSKSSKETKLGAQENSGAEVEHFKQLGAYMEGVQSAIGIICLYIRMLLNG